MTRAFIAVCSRIAWQQLRVGRLVLNVWRSSAPPLRHDHELPLISAEASHRSVRKYDIVSSPAAWPHPSHGSPQLPTFTRQGGPCPKSGAACRPFFLHSTTWVRSTSIGKAPKQRRSAQVFPLSFVSLCLRNLKLKQMRQLCWGASLRLHLCAQLNPSEKRAQDHLPLVTHGLLA